MRVNNGSLPRLTMAHRKVFVIKLANEEVNLTALFENLQKAASKNNTKLIQIATNDSLFTTCTMEEFKKCGNVTLRDLKVCLIKPPIKV